MTLKEKLHNIVFGTDTKVGRRFDIILLWIILFSVAVILLESVPAISGMYSNYFYTTEWILTIIFSMEYILRISISPKPGKYIISFWGIIDLLSILPTYLSLFVFGYHYFLTVRIFRLLRLFRVLKVARFNEETLTLISALKSSTYKISAFFMAVVAIVTFMGTLMYVVEGNQTGFTSIPQSIYWAVVTVTTVGYGDIVPTTAIGKFISSVAMIMGYAIIAVPTGIITAQMTKQEHDSECGECHYKNEASANYCAHCGKQMLIKKA
jgi:voltage-gated potassium channel